MLVLSLLIFFAHLHLQSHLMLPSGQKISISFWSHVILNLSREKYTWDCYWSKCSSVFLKLISAWMLYQRRQYHIFQLEHMKCFKCQTNSVTFNSYMYDCTVNTTLLNYSSLVFFSLNNWLHYSSMWAGTMLKWTIMIYFLKSSLGYQNQLLLIINFSLQAESYLPLQHVKFDLSSTQRACKIQQYIVQSMIAST